MQENLNHDDGVKEYGAMRNHYFMWSKWTASYSPQIFMKGGKVMIAPFDNKNDLTKFWNPTQEERRIEKAC